jgi:transposase
LQCNSSYLCVLVDNEKFSVYDFLDSHSKTNIALYFSSFSWDERCRVKYVTIDMWQPYKKVANTYFPNCIVAVGPFHVVKHLQSNFERLRVDIMNRCDYGSNAFTENVNGKLRTYLSVSKRIGNFERFRKRMFYVLNPDIIYGLTANLSNCKLYQKKSGPYCKTGD